MRHIVHDIGVAKNIGRYNDAIEVKPGLRWLYTSGTPGMTASGELPPDIESQTRIAWENIQEILTRAGMMVQDLVKVTTTLTDAKNIPAFVKIRSEVLGDVRPAFMLQIVDQLVRPDILVEIEIVAASRSELGKMDWDKLRAFSAAAEAGSFTHAGARLNLSQSAVSRQITGLEQALKTVLFHRHARGLKLTEQGELLQEAVKDVLVRVSMVETLLAERREVPCGSLKVSTAPGFGAFWLAPRLKEFHERYPEISLTLLLDGGEADLSMCEADVAIRLSAPKQPSLIQRRLSSVCSHAYAAPDYLHRHGVPRKAEDLDNHRIIALVDEQRKIALDTAWLLQLGARAGAVRQPVFSVDDVHGLYRAALSGFGIAALPEYTLAKSAGLVPLFPEVSSLPVDCYFVYPAELRGSKRVAVFRDFLINEFAQAKLAAPRLAGSLSDKVIAYSSISKSLPLAASGN